MDGHVEMSVEMLGGASRFLEVKWGDNGEALVWLERSDGQGRLWVRRGREGARPLTDGISVGGEVGYGGGGFDVQGMDMVYCSEGRLHRLNLERGLSRAITPAFGSVASPAISADGQWVAFVHRYEGRDRVAVVDIEGNRWPVIAGEGADFYMQPSWSPEGDELYWACWDHPAMPWNEARIERARWEGDGAGSVEGVAGEAGDEVARQQPLVSPDGQRLAYLSDGSGHWQVVVRHLESGQEERWSKEGDEYGGPAWIQGLRYMEWQDSTTLVAVARRHGEGRVERLSEGGEPREVAGFGTYGLIEQISVNGAGEIAALAQGSTTPPRVVVAGQEGSMPMAYSSSERLGKGDLSTAEPVSWEVDGQEVYGLYYAPTKDLFGDGSAPPALVMVHGGPTSQREAGWEARNQYFATRGWAVLDVNYRGSTGYGRAYMEALFGQWGVVDVADVVGGARYLADEGLADGSRIAIMGGSAGGYTVLQSLATHPGVFRAGVSLYGISNLFELSAGTHKFEAYYNDTLIGPLPESAERFRERSPLFSAERISDPVAIYHGAKDKVVPIDQAEAIVGSLKSRGVPHEFHVYDEEGHGWRREETVIHFHESVLEFLTRQVVYA